MTELTSSNEFYCCIRQANGGKVSTQEPWSSKDTTYLAFQGPVFLAGSNPHNTNINDRSIADKAFQRLLNDKQLLYPFKVIKRQDCRRLGMASASRGVSWLISAILVWCFLEDLLSYPDKLLIRLASVELPTGAEHEEDAKQAGHDLEDRGGISTTLPPHKAYDDCIDCRYCHGA